ncbi:MAG: response regulator transcription factor [Erysipelotrichaceae bacterium]|nr:response regulator transcription factor [Erysipelotrichaceae bacterium]
MLMKLLFVEDDQAIAMGLVYTLKKEGYEVVWCDRKHSALQQLDQQIFDLLLLDVGLPDGSGYDICTYAKSRQDVPVLFLTALDDEGNVVMGLDMGGDDYITKPFRINELLSRMRSVQRRYHRQEEDIVQIQYLSIYPKQGKVYKEQEEVLLTALEYRLLMVFVNHPQQVLSRSQLLEGIWDVAGDFVNDNTLTVYIKRLRERLERDPQNPTIIVTVRGMGYRLELHHAA